MTPEELAAIIDETVVENTRSMLAWDRFELREELGVSWILSGLPFPLFNFAFRSVIEEDDTDDAIRRVVESADAVRAPLVWFVGPGSRPPDLGDRLEAAGLIPAGRAAGMFLAIDPAAPPSIAPPAGVEIAEVANDVGLAAWSEVSARVFGVPAALLADWHDLYRAIGFGPGRSWRHVVATRGAAPVGAASVFIGTRAACVANVAVVEAERRRGIGAALTRGAISLAAEAGSDLVILMASADGESLYRGMGFRTALSCDFYLVGTDEEIPGH